jgi:hypothetical protein
MKTIFASFGWLLLLIPFISVAGTKTLFDKIHNAASVEERNVSDFTGISSGGPFDVYVKLGSTEDLRLEGDAEAIKNIETRVEKGILKIRHIKNNLSWSNREKVRIYITAKSLNTLALSGSGSMDVSSTIKSDVVNTQVSGSGSMRIPSLQSSVLNAAVSGSGSLRVAGSSQAAHIAVSGSGQFEGKNLKTEDANAKVSGSGGVTIHADEHLNAAVSGSGSILYSGNAEVNQSRNGSGRVSKN